MKPLSIADYLDHLDRPPGGNAPQRREASPFRPRSLQGAQNGEGRLRPAFGAMPKPVASEARAKEAARRSPFERKPAPASYPASPSSAGETVKPEDIASRLAEAYARGREHGLAEGRSEASDRHAAELAAMRLKTETDELEFRRGAYAGLESAIRSGLKEIVDTIGAAVTRILTPFLDQAAVKLAADELRAAIARLCEGGSPGLMTIRGPERALGALRERIAGLPVEIAYIEDGGPEVLVELNATRIVTALRSWSELLATLAD